MQSFSPKDRYIKPQLSGISTIPFTIKNLLVNDIYSKVLILIEFLTHYVNTKDTKVHIKANPSVKTTIQELFGDIIGQKNKSQLFANLEDKTYDPEEYKGYEAGIHIIDAKESTYLSAPNNSYMIFAPFENPLSAICYLVVGPQVDNIHYKIDLIPIYAKIMYHNSKIRGVHGKKWLNPVDFTKTRTDYDQCCKDLIIYNYLIKNGKFLISLKDVDKVDEYILNSLGVDLSESDYIPQERLSTVMVDSIEQLRGNTTIKILLSLLARVYDPTRALKIGQSFSQVFANIDWSNIIDDLKNVIDKLPIKEDLFNFTQIMNSDIFGYLSEEVKYYSNNMSIAIKQDNFKRFDDTQDDECDVFLIYYATVEKIDEILNMAKRKLVNGGFIVFISPDEDKQSIDSKKAEIINSLVNDDTYGKRVINNRSLIGKLDSIIYREHFYMRYNASVRVGISKEKILICNKTISDTFTF